ncbi:hypothetical protein ACT6QH_04775 [Xanthobacter sp. TB0139]|uniref:hypothetical protein n=1 Tax=Xanthobacter sp. TB0139 TaxID=3459178 RepID=UPI004039011B
MTPPGGSGMRSGRMLQPDDVLDLVSNLGYRNMSWPALVGRHYALTGFMDGAPMTLRVDAYSGRVVDVRPLEYGRGPRGYYPPEAPMPGDGAGAARAPAPARPRIAPLPPPRPVEATAPAGPPAGMPATPALSAGAPVGEAAASAPASQQAEPSLAAPEQPHPASSSAPSPAPEAPRQERANVGAGVGAAVSAGSAGTASVLSRPPVLETPPAQ